MQTEFGEQNAPTAQRAEFLFHLYIIEEEPRHLEILESLKVLFDEHLAGSYQLKTINVAHQPEQATRANVLATPTLIKLRPKPVQRVVGDLFVGEYLLKELRIFPSESF
jgi:circadian clock protein KaiB